jgi:hypothetical protein
LTSNALIHTHTHKRTKLFAFEFPRNIGSQAVVPFENGILNNKYGNPNGYERTQKPKRLPDVPGNSNADSFICIPEAK